MIFKAWLRGYRFSSVGVSGERNACNPTLVGVVIQRDLTLISFLEGIALLFGYLKHFLLS